MKKKGYLLGAAGLIMAFLMAACGSAGYYSSAKNSTASAGYESPAEAEDIYEDETPMYGAEESAAEYDDAGMAYAEDGDMQTASAGAESGEGSEDGYQNLDKIVYTCNVTMQTLDYDKTVADIRAKVKDYKGILSSEQETDNDSRWYYDPVYDDTVTYGSGSGTGNRRLYVTLRIPSGKYTEFVDSLSENGKILSRSQDAENISRRYNDKQAEIQMLETEEKRLLEMMDKAQTIDEMISVESRLTEVQTQLNQYRTELSAMDTDIAYSTVSIEVQEVRRLQDDPEPQDTFADRVKNAFRNTWKNFVSFCEYFVYAVIWLLPGIIVIGAVLAIVLFATRKQRAVRKAYRQQMRAQKQEMKRQYAMMKQAERENKANRRRGRKGSVPSSGNNGPGTQPHPGNGSAQPGAQPEPGRNGNGQPEAPEDPAQGAAGNEKPQNAERAAGEGNENNGNREGKHE